MSKPTSRPLVPVVLVLFLLVALLSPPAAIGASWADRGSAAFGRFLGFISTIWAEEGCEYDPNGRCHARQGLSANPGDRQITANAGCIFDPNGLCRSGATVEREAGCEYDPNGHCQP